jgi:hypothetical protein
MEIYQMTVLVLLVCVKFTCDYFLKSCNCDYAFSFPFPNYFAIQLLFVWFLLVVRPYQNNNNNHPSKQVGKYCLMFLAFNTFFQ